MTVRTAYAITIDGPGGAGKTTVGQLLAKRLGCAFVDTGDMYRALTWMALQSGVAPTDDMGLCRLAASAPITIDPSTSGAGSPYRVLIAGQDATPHLRSRPVEANVSLVSQVACVRQSLVAQQQRLAQGHAIIMAGRDIGTTVLPDARLKIYLDASPEERARRRYDQQAQQGDVTADRHRLQAQLMRRDSIDQERAESPLRPADDAVIINTNGLTVEEVVARILELLS